MESGHFTNYIRSKTLYDFYKNNPDSHEQANEKSNLIHVYRTLGAQNLYFQHKLIAACCPCIPQTYSSPDAVLIAYEAFLYYAVQQNWGPTLFARGNYIWFHTIVSAYSWVRPTSKISGVRDNWDWSKHYVLGEEAQFIWMNAVLIDIMPAIVPGYDTTMLEANERTKLSITVEEQLRRRTNVKSTAHWSEWRSAWQSWYNNRFGDGSLWYINNNNVIYACNDTGEAPNDNSNNEKPVYLPVNTDLPNQEKVLDPAETIFPGDWLEPRKWTPLCINTYKKTYLTYLWGDVRSSCLDATDTNGIQTMVTGHFPSNLKRSNEISDILLTTGSLTDAQKALSEFWAAGEDTVSSPGMFMWFWKEFMITKNIPRACNFDAFYYSGFDMAQHMFEASRVVWHIKKQNMQDRPIQEVRLHYYDTPVPYHTGSNITGRNWTPYQIASYVSPAYPEFPSGHSTFAQTFALVMTDWFGSRIPESNSRELHDLDLLSPCFTHAETLKYGQFILRANTSQIQSSVPAQDVEFRWTTWQEIADSVAISRKYGGVSATSSCSAGQAVAQSLHLRIRNKNGLTI